MPETTHQPSVELDNEKLTFNLADGTRRLVSVEHLSRGNDDHGLMMFAGLILSQAMIERQGLLADAVSQLAQAMGTLTQARSETNIQEVIAGAVAEVAKVMPQFGLAMPPATPGNGSAI